ncbi:HAMP domain-containing histidine kinase [Aggregicoccus sp. 17bor-14]|nr:HAMP domain-containing histidine kinase [Simulacricoccus sp. 17bor-14]MRI89815.1 HAMP domain-containing histidine kinase [Aggregicoccus sp. 17bor-14]
MLDAARYAAVPPLVESLLHDVRNPLNALAINLEVLNEKLKGEDGEVPAGQAKNLRAMREQVARVDGILRQFAEFLVHRAGPSGEASLSETLERVLAVLGHEGRRRRIKVQPAVEAGLNVRLADLSELGFLLLQPVLRAFERAEAGSEVAVVARGEGARVVLEVVEATDIAQERAPGAVAGLERACARLGVELQLRGGTCRLVFSRA